MVDEALARGIAVNAPALSRELGVPVVEMVATEGRGLQALRDALVEATPMRVPCARDAAARAAWAHEVTGQVRTVSTVPGVCPGGAVPCHPRDPITSMDPGAGAVPRCLVGVFGAQTLVGVMKSPVFGMESIRAAAWLIDRLLPFGFAHDFFVGRSGLVTMGLTYAVAIVLPVVTTFFLLFGFLEDSGYIPRLAVFSDRIFRAMGLKHRQGGAADGAQAGCDTMATMTTRILSTPKERLIAILLLALGIPCSAQLATILGILGGVSFTARSSRSSASSSARCSSSDGWPGNCCGASNATSSWNCRRSACRSCGTS